MNKTLIETLNGLPNDPTLAIQLYKQLFEANYFVLVLNGTEKNLEQMEFLTYNTKDNVIELPFFTNEEFVLKNLSEDAIAINIGGQSLWERLLDVIETGKCEVAINPSQTHGIRLTKEMILGMIANYGTK